MRVVARSLGRRTLGPLILLLALLWPVAAAQGIAALRLSPCVGLQPASIVNLCSVSGFAQTPDFGVFLQTRPIAGSPFDNWTVMIYVPTDQLSLGPTLLVQAQPGVSVGRERGEWIVGLAADIILQIQW